MRSSALTSGSDSPIVARSCSPEIFSSAGNRGESAARAFTRKGNASTSRMRGRASSSLVSIHATSRRIFLEYMRGTGCGSPCTIERKTRSIVAPENACSSVSRR
eukprot:Amastigsp_a132_250.p3 type:complete len:104 gc:universal Amastigsp_a132_250:1351-1662(+)